jgi:small membrane protein
MKWLLAGFFLFALSRAVLRFRDGNINGRELVLLSVFWLVASLVVIWPEVTGRLTQILGVGRMTDAVVYLTVSALCYFIFRIYIRIRNMEHKLRGLVRKLALRESERSPSPGEPPQSR